MSSIAVTGAAGFLGRHVTDALLRQGRSVRCIDHVPFDRPSAASFVCDISDTRAIVSALAGAGTLIHLAWSGVIAAAAEGYTTNNDANLAASLRLLETAKGSGIKRVVFASSGGAVYGMHPVSSISEDEICRPISDYGAGKAAFEAHGHSFSHANGMEFIALRVSNLYGPGQSGDLGQGLVSTTIWKILRRHPIEIWGDGSVIRDYVYVSDVADAFVRAAQYDGPPHIFNIGTGIGRSVVEVIRSVETAMEASIEIIWKPPRPVDVPHNVLNPARAAQQLGWRAATPFDAGVRQTILWSKKQFRNDAGTGRQERDT